MGAAIRPSARPWEVPLDVTHDTVEVHRRLRRDGRLSLLLGPRTRWVIGQQDEEPQKQPQKPIPKPLTPP